LKKKARKGKELKRTSKNPSMWIHGAKKKQLTTQLKDVRPQLREEDS